MTKKTKRKPAVKSKPRTRVLALASGSASVERTIEDMIAGYPSLFWSRTLALHHLFVVLGCGYRWKNGELVEIHSERTEDRIPRRAAKILARYRPPLERPPYPYFDRCNLATMPTDAKPAWKAAAEEARAALPNVADDARSGRQSHSK
jgi:hypothetical protein